MSDETPRPSEAKRELSRKLRQAVKFGRINEIESLLEQGADVDAPNSAGPLSLILAIRYGQVDAARLLLERGADVNGGEWGNRGRPLLTAVVKDQTDVVRLLLERGADVNGGEPDYRGWPLEAV